MTIDPVAVAQFITDTAFIFAYEIMGAVIAFSILLELIFWFRKIISRGSFLNESF